MSDQPDQPSAYEQGKAQQALMFAARPDASPEQWTAVADELVAEMAQAVLRVEKLRGRLDAIGLHVLYARPRPVRSTGGA